MRRIDIEDFPGASILPAAIGAPAREDEIVHAVAIDDGKLYIAIEWSHLGEFPHSIIYHNRTGF